VSTLKHHFLQIITIKMELALFHYKHNVKLNSYLHLLFGSDIYRQQVTTCFLAGVGIINYL
jgi:hypothetical protein